jgi:hypothetical protein
MNELAQAHLKAGHLVQALPLLREQLRRCKAKLGKAHPDTQSVMGDLARALVDSQPAEAERIARELLAIRQQQLPNDWRTFQTQSLLGACLLKQHNYVAAEPLLVEGYQGMRARAQTIPRRFRSRVAEAQGRLNELRTERARLAQVPALAP